MKQENRLDSKELEALLRGEGDIGYQSFIGLIDKLYAPGPGADQRVKAYSQLKQALQDQAVFTIAYDWLEGTPFGDLFVAVSDQGVIALVFGGSEDDICEKLTERYGATIWQDSVRVSDVVEQLGEYFKGARGEFDIKFDLSALTPFQRMVLEAVQKVPKGSYVTYLELARRIGKPKSARAVGQALGRNPIPILIPCHRVIATDGSLGGYSGPGGVGTKSQLLRMEGAVL